MKLSWTIIVGIIGTTAVLAYFLLRPAPVEIASGPMVSVQVPTLDTRADQGQVLFAANCVSCHGPNAAGQDGVAPPLIHKIYRPDHHADVAFMLAVKNGVRAHHWTFGNMPPVPDVASNEIETITYYLRTLQRANGIN